MYTYSYSMVHDVLYIAGYITYLSLKKIRQNVTTVASICCHNLLTFEEYH